MGEWGLRFRCRGVGRGQDGTTMDQLKKVAAAVVNEG